MPEPSEIALPAKPQWKVPPVVVLTPKEVETYQQYCDLFKKDDSELAEFELADKEAIIAQGQNAENFCNWAIYGFTVQDWLSFEEYMLSLASYIDNLRQAVEFYKNQLEARQSIIREAEEQAKQSENK